VGRFDEAVQAGTDAHKLAVEANNQPQAQGIARHLAVYRARRPLHP
jgi:hypothetical protein